MSHIDWGSQKGIADEPHFDRFMRAFGGKKVSEIRPNPEFENADYFFEASSVIAELKILETEFGDSPQFKRKLSSLIHRHVTTKGLRGPLLGQPFTQEYLRDFVELFRSPLARLVKKANRQIKATKVALGKPDAMGILICINDNFRSLEPRFILRLLGRILIGANSSIDGFIYHTNHYVHIPGNEYANLLWVPSYSEGAPDSLVNFVDDLGRGWYDFIERETGPLDWRSELPHGTDASMNAMTRSRAIKPKRA